MKKILVVCLVFGLLFSSCTNEDVKPLKILRKKQERFDDPKAPPPPPPPVTN